jgi:hypothetical protein
MEVTKNGKGRNKKSRERGLRENCEARELVLCFGEILLWERSFSAGYWQKDWVQRRGIENCP